MKGEKIMFFWLTDFYTDEGCIFFETCFWIIMAICAAIIYFTSNLFIHIAVYAIGGLLECGLMFLLGSGVLERLEENDKNAWTIRSGGCMEI
jgi:hypothetical protein